MSTIGERIADLRTRRGMTQVELGEAIGETKQTIYKYEHGIISNIPLQNIEKIAKALRCPPVALTGWVEEEDMQDREQKDRDEALLDAFRELPPEEQEIVIAQTRGLAHRRKGLGTL